MAVISSKRRSRRTALAIALAGVMLPGMALAQEDRGARGWSGRAEHQADRSENRGNSQSRGGGEERGGGWQRPMPQQASPQGQAASQPGGWQARGNWAGHAAQAAPAPVQPQWSGTRPSGNWTGNRSDGNRDGDRRGGNWQGQDGPRQGPGNNARPGTTYRGEGSWANRDNWRDGDRNQDRDRDRARNQDRDGDRWRDRDRDHWRNDGDRNWNRGGYWDNRRDGRTWDRDWRRDNRYNWYNYRSRHRDIYRLRPYYAPYRNYYYRRIGIGFFLDALFYGDRYWIADPWYYRLPEAYGPYRWVRYYDDALLVDIYTGEVVDVIYDFFW